MGGVKAFEVQDHFAPLPDEPQRGESITSARYSHSISSVDQAGSLHQREVGDAIAGIRALGQRTGTVTLDELLLARHEGHKY